MLHNWAWRTMTPSRHEKERVDVTVSYSAFTFKPDLHLLLPSAETLLATVCACSPAPGEVKRGELKSLGRLHFTCPLD